MYLYILIVSTNPAIAPVNVKVSVIVAILPAPIVPTGLPPDSPDVSQLMHQLDGALFMKQYQGQPWSMDELKRLSAFGARFKETAVLTNNFPLGNHAFRKKVKEC